MRDKRREVAPDEMRSREILGEREIVINVYCIENLFFNKRKKLKLTTEIKLNNVIKLKNRYYRRKASHLKAITTK